jgi:hypothetical protein
LDRLLWHIPLLTPSFLREASYHNIIIIIIIIIMEPPSTTTINRSPGNVYHDAFDAVGSTPLLKLQGPSEQTGCTIYGKCEFAECGAGMSVKARAAKWMLLDAEERGLLKPGGTVVEATAGT